MGELFSTFPIISNVSVATIFSRSFQKMHLDRREMLRDATALAPQTPSHSRAPAPTPSPSMVTYRSQDSILPTPPPRRTLNSEDERSFKVTDSSWRRGFYQGFIDPASWGYRAPSPTGAQRRQAAAAVQEERRLVAAPRFSSTSSSEVALPSPFTNRHPTPPPESPPDDNNNNRILRYSAGAPRPPPRRATRSPSAAPQAPPRRTDRSPATESTRREAEMVRREAEVARRAQGLYDELNADSDEVFEMQRRSRRQKKKPDRYSPS